MPIHNPVAFIGEVVFNATPGVPLVADSNSQLASGLSAIEVSDTANATTTSGTPAVLTTMTITATPGTYLVWFSASTTSNGTNCTQTFGLYNNGSLKADSARTIQPYDGGTLAAATAVGSVAINAIVTVIAGAVDIRWSTAGGTATCHQRTLNMLRVS